MKQNIVSGLIGGLIVIAFLAVMCMFGSVFDYKAITIVRCDVITDSVTTAVSEQEYELMNSLREKGVLLTPTEYTNNIVGYYNSLIAFLAVFFIIFTFVGYFCIKNISKKEVRDEAKEILMDSQSFRSDVVSAISGEFDGNYESKENCENAFREMNNRIGQIIDEIDRLKECGSNVDSGKVVKKVSKTKKA